jgi:hypothetical protein
MPAGSVAFLHNQRVHQSKCENEEINVARKNNNTIPCKIELNHCAIGARLEMATQSAGQVAK